MKKLDINLKDVNAVYDGPEGQLWELIMGEQIHVGGWQSSKTLADKAGIKADMKVLDLCSALGAGLRFLVKNYQVKGFGLDGTKTMHEQAQKRVRDEGLGDSIELKLGNVMDIPWDKETFDVVWGEDAWCYVEDKAGLITEAARVLKPGGTIAFTDWIEGPVGIGDDEAERINRFMKFPYVESLKGYEKILGDKGFTVKEATDLTLEFAEYCHFYIRMLTEQLTYDALRIIGDDQEMFAGLGGEMQYMAERAKEGKFGRGRWIAVKR
ncbi:class I SAM-dependent methyltransferase [Myxococcota bacterium]